MTDHDRAKFAEAFAAVGLHAVVAVAPRADMDAARPRPLMKFLEGVFVDRDDRDGGVRLLVAAELKPGVVGAELPALHLESEFVVEGSIVVRGGGLEEIMAPALFHPGQAARDHQSDREANPVGLTHSGEVSKDVG